MTLISSGDAFSFQMTMPRMFMTLPTHDERRAASSIFWIFSRSTGRNGRKNRMVRRLPMVSLTFMGLLPFRPVLVS